MSDLKNIVKRRLQDLQNQEMRTAALGLLNELGYKSNKTLELDGSPAAFLEQFNQQVENPIDEKKACVAEWVEIQLLFQLTDEELGGQAKLFQENAVAKSLMQSYLFFAVKLTGSSYARGKLANIARQLNRLFPMPVMVLFEYDEKLSIAVINRRRNKRDDTKDVLGKVTLIHEVSLIEPHRGHLDIIASFALSELAGTTGIQNFDQLHAAWESVFNVELLNKNFYREISNWYFWAMQSARFPIDQLLDQNHMDKGDLFADKEKIREHDAKNLIRLLTRLLFVWFIKEKGLIPDDLFDRDQLRTKWLTDFDPTSKDTRFYKAILQNLFFAALNQPVNEREFRKEGRQHRNITNLMRYQSLFRDPDAFVAELKAVVPFMNGGLFECLDKPHPKLKGPQGGDVILYEDGFSDRKDNALKLPDELFFGDEQTINLSDVYGDPARSNEKVRGIINILNDYRFTIVENTPIEQEIALDPELLGQVFENLLASYNPETKTTARKQTGSFYTPRTIVDYMVDESLKAHLTQSLTADGLMTEESAKLGLEILFAYTEKEHAFTLKEKARLISAIDTCKILDPACGSGAYPMGILHKLVFVLSKLDPGNQLWKKQQLDKLDSASMREDLEATFADNDDDYGRKLYLIENCIYGVDIQPIATQVSRLRFFISLIVDQKRNPDAANNFGIRPLPNLESKFATADSLIKIDKPAAQGELFDSPEIKELEAELKEVRHRMFSAKTPKTKKKYRERDTELRGQIAEQLEANGWSNAAASQLSEWDPYDQNAVSPFFDPEWMFDLKGFDVVIGNPPYVQIQKFAKAQKDKWVAQNFQTYAATADIYCLFYERGAQLLKEGGHLSYITSNNWMRANYGKKLRDFLSSTVNTKQVLDFGMGLNFNAAAALTNILTFANESHQNQTRCCYAVDTNMAMAEPAKYCNEKSVLMPELNENSWVVVSPERYRIKKMVEAQGVVLEDWDLKIIYGVKTGLNDAFYLTQEQRDELIAKEPHAADIIVPLLRGRYVGRYATSWDKTWMIGTFPALNLKMDNYPEVKKHLATFRTRLTPKPRGHSGKWGGRKAGSYDWFETQDSISYHREFRKPKIIYPEITKWMPFFYDAEGDLFTNQKCFIMCGNDVPFAYLTAVFNSFLFKCCFKNNFPELLGDTRELRKVFMNKIPIKRPTEFEAGLFGQLVPMVQFAKRESMAVESAFLEELIDACVLELYFPEEAADKDLQFMKQTATLLKSSSSGESRQNIESFVAVANDPNHLIRNRLDRILSDSPDLFAVIKREGEV